MNTTIKLHLHLVTIGGYTYRILKLRPSDTLRLSNNYFHDTWHLLTDQGGVELLARLFWGLSHQKKPGTLLLIDAPHITTTPFEGDAALPCLIIPDGITRADKDLLRALHSRLRHLGAPTTTVTLQSFGLEEADDLYKRHHIFDDELKPLWSREKMSQRGGFLCYTAPALVLQLQAVSIRRLRRSLYQGSNYTYLAEGDWRNSTPQGEVQIFADFTDRVAAASLAHQQLVGDAKRDPGNQRLQEKLWNRTEKFTSRRMKARKGGDLLLS
jgi:hypothetical protein